jgi:hypothetical protein
VLAAAPHERKFTQRNEPGGLTAAGTSSIPDSLLTAADLLLTAATCTKYNI